MRIVYMGSAGFACASLEAIVKAGRDQLRMVVTQPDRPQGRHLEVAGCPVKRYLAGRDIPVFAPENINAPESLERVREANPDVIVVVAYGQILKQPLLELAPLGCVNVHGSLLPKYRGAAPIQWAIANGETVTGVTTMFVNRRMDAGDIILKQEVGIGPEETGGGLHDRLAPVGAQLLLETLELVRRGQAPRYPQDESAATYAPKLSKADGWLDWHLPAKRLYDRVRAFHPWPGCCCELPAGSGVRIKVLKAEMEASEGIPGTVVAVGEKGVLVQAGAGYGLRLVEVQPEGRKAMSAANFLRGRRIAAGCKVG